MARKNKTKCKIDGCNNLVDYWYKKVDGAKMYRDVCRKHHCQKYGMKYGDYAEGKLDKRVYDISRMPCALCGWNKSYCDRHRIVKGEEGGKYRVGNVIPLCPNCHRELHNLI